MGLAISKSIMGLSALLLFLFPWNWFHEDTNIKITDWDGINQYEGTVNGDPVIIQLEDIDTSKPGKIKIVFKDSKKNGTTLIYERDMEDGEISEQDQVYIERVLASIEEFHKKNRTYVDVKEKLNWLWKQTKDKSKKR